MAKKYSRKVSIWSNKADRIGKVRLVAGEYRRKGLNKSDAFKKSWRVIKKANPKKNRR